MSFYDNCGNNQRLSLIAGPCVFESKDHAVDTAEQIQEICDSLDVNFIYKTSFDKANRSSADSFRSAGFDEAYYGMEAVRGRGIEVLTDVHDPWQCEQVQADIIQIPAFLCRQTDLIRAAAESGKPVNVKKGQFLSPWEMSNVADKLKKFGCTKYMFTERGTTFGYNNLVVDMRSLDVMKHYTDNVVMDCTHAVQLPGGAGKSSSGQRQFVSTMARAAVGVGVSAVFIEVHKDPDNAPSDGANMLRMDKLCPLLSELVEIDYIVKRKIVWKS